MNAAPIRCLHLRFALLGPDVPAALARFSRGLVIPAGRPTSSPRPAGSGQPPLAAATAPALG